MKKVMLVLVVLAMVCEVSIARSESQMAVIRHGEIFKVIYKNGDLSSVKVSIANEDGEQVFTEEVISNQGFIRPYNFSQLPKGYYTIHVADGSDEKSKKIHFTDQPWAAHLSRLSNDKMKIMVAVPHQGVNDFTIQILDRNNQVIYEEDQKVDAEFAKVFNLNKLERGATVSVVKHVTGDAKSLEVD
jgi:hypothetical protein